MVAQNNTGRYEWILNVNVAECNVGKVGTALCGAVCAAGEWIGEGAVATEFCVGFVLLLGAYPNGPPEWFFHVDVLVTGSFDSDGGVERIVCVCVCV